MISGFLQLESTINNIGVFLLFIKMSALFTFLRKYRVTFNDFCSVGNTFTISLVHLTVTFKNDSSKVKINQIVTITIY
jgi:hypothetical protein